MAKLFTLFIDTHSIKIAIIRNEQVQEWADISLEPGLVDDGVIQDVGKLATLLEKELKAHKIKNRRVFAGLTGLGSLYRIINLPALPESIVPEAIRREAERVVPVPLEEVYLSYQRLPSTGKDIRIFLAICPKDTLDPLVHTIQKAGLEIALLDLAPLAICRSVNIPKAVVASIEGVVLNIIVMMDRVPEVIRSIQIPEELSSDSGRLDVIAEEIDRTVTFYNSSQPENQLDKSAPLFVCGDVTKSPESMQTISSKLGRPVEILPSPLMAPSDFDAGQFMVNIGLALKKQRKKYYGLSLVDSNVLPEKYIVKHFSPLNVVIPVGAAAVLILIGFMTYQILNNRSEILGIQSQLNAQQKLLELQQKDLAGLKQTSTQLQQEIQPVEQVNKALTAMAEGLQVSRTTADEDTATLVDLLSGSVKLTDVKYTPEKFTLSGSAFTRQEVYGYARDLRSSGRFVEVTIESISLNQITTREQTQENNITTYIFDIALKK